MRLFQSNRTNGSGSLSLADYQTDIRPRALLVGQCVDLRLLLKVMQVNHNACTGYGCEKKKSRRSCPNETAQIRYAGPRLADAVLFKQGLKASIPHSFLPSDAWSVCRYYRLHWDDKYSTSARMACSNTIVMIELKNNNPQVHNTANPALSHPTRSC